jgi:site-specific recombinase XerC
LRPATLRRRLAAISWQHQEHGRSSPCRAALVRASLADIERVSTLAIDHRTPISLPNLRRLLGALPNTRIGLRDRAMLSLAFAAALGRGELVQLDYDQVRTTGSQLLIAPTEASPVRSIPAARDSRLCPVRAHLAWLDASGITDGPLYRPIDRHGRVLERRLTDRAVGLIVERAADQAELADDAISADSLRLGGAALHYLGLTVDDLAAGS